MSSPWTQGHWYVTLTEHTAITYIIYTGTVFKRLCVHVSLPRMSCPDIGGQRWLIDSGTIRQFQYDFSTIFWASGDRKSIRPVNMGCWFVGADNFTGALHVLQLQLSQSPPSSSAPDITLYSNTNIHYDKLTALLQASSLQHLPVRFWQLCVHYEFLHLARLCTRWPVVVFLCRRQPHERHRPPSLSPHHDCRHPWMWRLQTCTSFTTATMRQIGSIHVHSTRTVTCPVSIATVLFTF